MAKKKKKPFLRRFRLPDFDIHDTTDMIAVLFALLGISILISGYLVVQPAGTFGVIGDAYDNWLGILVDAVLLWSINQAIRREEKQRLIGQFGSESNAFALDAAKQLRQKGWLENGKLKKINLAHADLEKANLGDADLEGADFSYARLKKAKFIQANLKDSNMLGVDLRGAECRWADFRGVNLRWANLDGAMLEGAKFDGADLRFAKLGDVDKQTVSLKRTRMMIKLTPAEIQSIRESIEYIPGGFETLSNKFYEILFAECPEVKRLFIDHVSNQAMKFAQMFKILTGHLDDMQQLLPALRALGKRHHNYGVEEEHYAVVGTALMSALEELHGDRFEADKRAAWARTYSLISTIMLDAAKEEELAA